ncbi:transporter [Polynucleobacter sp. UK-Gri1-W3]|uniref:transporter n=1 Tax=Polynucleobacter sp. UK-Gri1-W3 TaxID=1819737 RepID=UPI001C0CF30E|nr:transporter [Polynucleobacter sp. UK-Gri1-W3]
MPTLVFAFEPLNTDDAGTVKAGGNQIEQYFFSINRQGGSQQADIITPGEEYTGRTDAKAFPFTYTRGLSDQVEASVSATYFNEPSGNYSKFANYVLASKWRFYEDGDQGYALAIKPTVVLPAGKQQQVAGLGLAAFNYGVNFIASKYWQDIELHLNAVYMRSPYNTNYSVGTSTDLNRTNIFLVSIAPVWSISKSLKIALDVGAATNPPSSEQYLSHYALIAGIYSLTDNIDLGVSYMRTGSSYGETFAAQQAGATRSEVGVTWRF